MMNRLFFRGFVYEMLMFFCTLIIASIIVDNPFKSLLLTVIITVVKIPIYYWFHSSWRD